MPDAPKKFYLTTPIYYVNARPHIGHAYSTIAADVIARRHRLLGDDTFFLTGTDEHGQKVQRSAAAAGIPPQRYADEVSATFRDLWARMGITNDDYIRTTDPRHKRGVQKLWRDLEARGAIYLSTYTGQYSVGEEMFVDGPPGTIGPDGKPTETVTEENYFFKLSEYQERLIDLVADLGPDAEFKIQPFSALNEVLQFLTGDYDHLVREYFEMFPTPNGALPATEASATWCIETGRLKRSPRTGILYIPGALKDLSISRTTFDWGIPVPGNEKHVVYVWLDALANYMTAIGYGSDDPADIAKFKKYWPADLHLVGKEITRFHCVYWPAFLMAAGLPLPKSVVANGWLLFEESKMSKSRGNVVRTETILDAFGLLCPPVATDGSSSGLQPAESTRLEPGALAPGLASPTKAQQDLFASDVIRYFLLCEIPFGQDGSFSFDALITRYNADLANGYGNLVSRTLKLAQDNFVDGFSTTYKALFVFSEIGESNDVDFVDETFDGWFVGHKEQAAHLDLEHADTLEQSVERLIESYEFRSALQQIWSFIRQIDGYLSEFEPWKIAKQSSPDARELLEKILYTAAESIRWISALLYPVMPYATGSVWRQLGLGDIEEAARNGELKNLQWGGLKPGTKLGPLAPIFPRADKGLALIMNDMESKTNSTAAAPLAENFSEIAPKPEVAATSNPTENPQPATGHSPTVAIDDFVKVDLRVAQIVVAERIPKADKLLRLEVDLGYERRQILSGIAEWYTPEELIGRRIAVIANLAPRKMRGLESHGMLLAASADDHASKPILASFSDEVPLGSRIR